MNTARNHDDIAPIVRLTGIEELDHDHHLLFGYALELNNLMIEIEKEHFNLDFYYRVGELFVRLKQQMEVHFKREEEWLHLSMIPDFESHKAKHKTILEELQEAINDILGGKHTLTTEIKYRVLDWVFEHNNSYDAHYTGIDKWMYCIQHATKFDQLKGAVLKTGFPDLDRAYEVITTNLLKINEKNEVEGQLKRIFVDVMKLFKLEQDLMRSIQHPISPEHESTHQQFLELIQQQIKQCQTAEPIQIRFELLYDWIDHLLGVNHKELSIQNWGIKYFKTGRVDLIHKIIPPGTDISLERQKKEIHELFAKLEYYYHSIIVVELGEQWLPQVREFTCALTEKIDFYFKSFNTLTSIDKIYHDTLVKELNNFNLLIQSKNFSLATFIKSKIFENWLGHLVHQHMLRSPGLSSHTGVTRSESSC